MDPLDPEHDTPVGENPSNRSPSKKLKTWGIAAGIMVLAAFALWGMIALSNSYESSPSARGTKIEHEATDRCRGITFIVVDTIKQTIADPGSFEWRDGHSIPSRHDLQIGETRPDQTAQFIAHFRHKTEYGGYRLDQRRGIIEMDPCAVVMPRHQ